MRIPQRPSDYGIAIPEHFLEFVTLGNQVGFGSWPMPQCAAESTCKWDTAILSAASANSYRRRQFNIRQTCLRWQRKELARIRRSLQCFVKVCRLDVFWAEIALGTEVPVQ